MLGLCCGTLVRRGRRREALLWATAGWIVPLLYGGAWAEFSTRNYTGWPSSSNPYMTPVPNTPYLEYTVLQLKPKS